MRNNTNKNFSKIYAMSSKHFFIALSVAALIAFTSPASADTINFTGPDGLSGTADFSISGGNLVIVLTNTSTGVPSGFSNSDQLLTSIAFDLPGSMTITGGSVLVGTGSTAYFETGTYGAPSIISGEWGYGNSGTTGFGTLVNYVSAMQAGTTAFSVTNLDGPAVLDGPQSGLTNGIIPLGGLGAVQSSVLITLNLNGTLSNLDFLNNGVIIEFGSDAAFVPVPESATLLLLGSGLIGLWGLRRKFKK